MADNKTIKSINFEGASSSVAIVEYVIKTSVMPYETIRVPVPLSRLKDELSKSLPDNREAIIQIKERLRATGTINTTNNDNSDDNEEKKNNIIFQNLAHARLVAIIKIKLNQYIVISAYDYNKNIELLTTNSTEPLTIYAPTIVNVTRFRNTHNSQWVPHLKDLSSREGVFSFDEYGIMYTKTPASEITMDTKVRVPKLPNIYSASYHSPHLACTGSTVKSGYSLPELIDFHTIFLGNKFNNDLTPLSEVEELYKNNKKYIFEDDDYNLTPALTLKQMLIKTKLIKEGD